MRIQPLQIWKSGELVSATRFNLRIVSDDLSNHATFYYSLESDSRNLITEGNLTIAGEEYHQWGNSQDINLEAYEWACSKLSLTLSDEQDVVEQNVVPEVPSPGDIVAPTPDPQPDNDSEEG